MNATIAPTRRLPRVFPQRHVPHFGDGGPEPRGFRPDIEGLRAVAVLLVVLYHARLFNVTGGYIGVDVFFVLSGFLITRQLVTNVARRGSGELPAFYARRIRRLLPASTVVVVGTIVAARLWVPPLQAKTVTIDAMFTTFYGLNYRLALNGTDYMHQNDAVSPLQHFWSLGVEEQFYLAWPLLVVLVFLLPRAVRRSVLAFLLLAVVVGSLYLSVTTTAAEPAWAYFSITTRAWELAAGGLVAVTSSLWMMLPRWPANVLAWTGLAAVVASAWVLDDNTPYPGIAAAVPVGATALILGCGTAPRIHSIERLLAEPFIQGIGKISYSWYLWHWPVLIIAPFIAGGALAWPRRVEMVLLSLLMAILSYHIVENPSRRLVRPNVHWMRIGAVLACVVVGTAYMSANTIDTNGEGLAAHAVAIDVSKPGLQARMAKTLNDSIGIQKAPRNMTPTAAKAQDDVASSRHDGCESAFTDKIEQPACVYGDPKGTRTAVLFGDSHAEQYASGLAMAAAQMHWKLVVWTRAACAAADVTVYAPALKRTYTECDVWRDKTVAKIQALRPNLVLMSQSDDAPGSTMPDRQFAKGTADTVRQFTDRKIAVTFLADTPLPNFDVPGCVAGHLSTVDMCTFPLTRAYHLPTRRATAMKAAGSAGARVVDPVGWICGRSGCPVIVGNILVWRDTGHMTATYSRWLTPVLKSLLVLPSSPKATGG